MTTIATRLGRVRGLADGGVLSFLGIRYGEPPVGPQRFKPAIASQGWDGTFDATRHPNRAIQNESRRIIERKVPGALSEDCLYLNIYTPAADGKPRPVMVWIHGGAFVGGSANEYDGNVLAAQGNIVVVTVNFRLGILGFFGLSDFGPDYAGSESNGIRDVLLALQWVQDNIADYGGDPENVTIAGESSGATMVLSLLATPAADVLYHRAIANSATCVFRDKSDRRDQLAERLGVAKEQLLEKLMAMTAEEIAAIDFPVGVCVDGDVITRPTMDAIRDRGAAGVPLLTGSNLREGALYTQGDDADKDHYPAFNQGLAKEALLGKDPTNFLDALRDAFPDASPGKFHEMIWNSMFRRICMLAAEATAAAGLESWFYRFDLPANLKGMEKLGAAHASELAFTFNIFEKPETDCLVFHDRNDPVVRRVAQAWSDAVVRFIKDGNPNGGDLPDWPTYDVGDRNCLIINEEFRIETDPDQQLRALWNS